MVTAYNDERAGERRFEEKARSFLNKLAIELSQERPRTQYTISVKRDFRLDDPAKYINLVQVGPERGFFRLKRKKLVSARCSDYESHSHPIQIECSDPTLEARAISGFEKIGQTENGQSVHVWRHSYSL